MTTRKFGCFGESTMTGYGLPLGQSIPELLQTMLPVDVFVNCGIPATTAKQMLLGTDGSGSTFAWKMANMDLNAVIVNYGLNDALRGTPQDEFRETMMTIAAVAQARGKHVIFESPNATYSGEPKDAAADLCACTVKSIAEEFGVFFSDGNGVSRDEVRHAGGSPAALYQAGGIHPTLALYEAMVADLIGPLGSPVLDQPYAGGSDTALLRQLTVAPLYHAAFGRAPDAPGQRYWANELAAGATPASIATAFMATPTWLNAHAGGAISNPEFIDGLYHDVFDKAPDDGGYWAGRMEEGMTRAEVMVAFGDVYLRVIGVLL